MAQLTFPTWLKHALLEQDLVTLQAMKEHYILVKTAVRALQYVAKCYLDYKWYLGKLIIKATKYHQCTRELS